MKKFIKLLFVTLAISVLSLMVTACGGQKSEPKQEEAIFTVNETGETITGLTDYGKTLSRIEIPTILNNVQIIGIGKGAFYNCDSMTEIVIPSSVISIGSEAFGERDSFTIYCEAPVPSEEPNWSRERGAVVWDCKNNEVANDDYIYTLQNGIRYALKDGVAKVAEQPRNIAGNITIPKKVTYKGTAYNVTSIGYRAFRGCGFLTEIVIHESVTSIGDYAFDYCYALTIYCEAESEPNRWNDGGCPVVWNCKNNDVADDGNIYTVQNGIRYALKDGVATVTMQPKNNTESITIPASVTYNGSTYPVTSIGDRVFRYYDSLTQIAIPDSVTSIGSYAFYECYSLTTIKVGSNNAIYKDINGNLYSKDGTTLIQYAVGKTEASFTVPNNVTSIGKNAFCYCSSLTAIEIPSSVTYIGGYAFSVCDCLTIYCEAESQPSGWDSAWNGYDYRPVVWNSVNNDVADDGNIYTVQNGIRYALKDGVATVVKQPYTISGSITIPASVTYNGTAYNVTSIGVYAFYACIALTKVVIPNSVTSIGEQVFYGCLSLTEIVIPNSVTSIGYRAFLYCSSLTNIVIPNSVTSIGKFAFSSCDSLTEITFSDTSTWYRTDDYTNWENKTGGMQTDVTNPTTNANEFTSYGYGGSYWYKLD